MSASVYLVIMAGGSGTRFWPKSTSRIPKQLLSFAPGSPTLLQATLKRFQGVVPDAQQIIVTTEALSSAITEQVPPQVKVLKEPQGRNTAPCVYWAAREIAAQDPKGIMLLMPADHTMAKEIAFRNTLKQAIEWATTHDDLVTLGVKPTRPETGYGYLKSGNTLDGNALKVDAFVEKPNLEKAKSFFDAGSYFWNGGMFIWRAEVILKAFDEFMPEMKRAWDQGRGNISLAYPGMTATSIDYGVMEKAKNVVMFPLDCGWDDLGSWTSLEDLAERLGIQKETNVVSSGELVGVESSGNIVDVPGKLVALLGVTDFIIAENGNRLLICHKSKAQEIKQIVDLVKKRHPDKL